MNAVLEFTWKHFVNSPSRAHGISMKEEMYLRASSCRFIDQLARHPSLKKSYGDKKSESNPGIPGRVAVWAMAIFHQFYFRASFAKINRWEVAVACLSLASKAKSQSRQLIQLIKAARDVFQSEMDDEILIRSYKIESIMLKFGQNGKKMNQKQWNTARDFFWRSVVFQREFDVMTRLHGELRIITPYPYIESMVVASVCVDGDTGEPLPRGNLKELTAKKDALISAKISKRAKFFRELEKELIQVSRGIGVRKIVRSKEDGKPPEISDLVKKPEKKTNDGSQSQSQSQPVPSSSSSTSTSSSTIKNHDKMMVDPLKTPLSCLKIVSECYNTVRIAYRSAVICFYPPPWIAAVALHLTVRLINASEKRIAIKFLAGWYEIGVPGGETYFHTMGKLDMDLIYYLENQIISCMTEDERMGLKSPANHIDKPSNLGGANSDSLGQTESASNEMKVDHGSSTSTNTTTTANTASQ